MKAILMVFMLFYSAYSLADDKYCTSPKQTMDEIYENGAITNCVYKGMNLLTAYKKYVNEHEDTYLDTSLKLNQNKQKEYADGSISVDYKWESPRRLVIEQQFSGGNTDLLLVEDKAGTKITITGYPD